MEKLPSGGQALGGSGYVSGLSSNGHRGASQFRTVMAQGLSLMALFQTWPVMNLETAVGLNRQTRETRENKAPQHRSLATPYLTQQVNSLFGPTGFPFASFASFAVSTASSRMKLLAERSRAGGAEGVTGPRPMTVWLRPSSNRTSGFPASGFPRVLQRSGLSPPPQ